MMATRCQDTNFDITSNDPLPPLVHMPFDQKYNVNWELVECLELLYDILEALEDIIYDLETGKTITDILAPPFDPLKTIGKY